MKKQSPRGVLEKKVFLEISQNSQENTCARDSLLINLHFNKIVEQSSSYCLVIIIAAIFTETSVYRCLLNSCSEKV